VKPFKYTYEKEIVMYAYFKKLDYFSTECVYAPFAARGFARDFVKDLEVRMVVMFSKRIGLSHCICVYVSLSFCDGLSDQAAVIQHHTSDAQSN
jgi:tRNA(Ile)-lysidine synthase TilS/MesJ